ncbi:LysE family translocator [Corynebacterium sp. CCUG 65737]|uniref:LysE family translocator n=1 Tax=Corynebacterium sp. CCUG 65737 TaxID=2823889 RepID=UPI00210E8E38|nr:LysE family translocator [Corynebacterium sp. CCUG 65737]
MTVSTYLALIGIWIAAIASPGPDLVQIIRVGAKSRAAGVACAFGIMAGNALWIAASLLGLGALIQAVPQVLAVLQLIGGAYLLWMGVGAVRSGLAARGQGASSVSTAATDTTDAPPAGTVLSARRAFATGVLTNLSNPKAVLFFGAVFAQFMTPGMGWGWVALILVTLALIGVAWFVGFAVGVDKLAGVLARWGHIVDVVTGVIFVALAVWMIAEGALSVAASL